MTYRVKTLPCKVISEKLNWSRDHPFFSNFSLKRPRVRVLGSKWDRILLGVRVRVRVMG